jgi:putative PIN family toxin of toxin-antitoxin system
VVQGRLKPGRVVFDTNVAVSALIFTSGRLAWLRPEWRAGGLVPLASKATVEEILRVLSYPKFRLSQSEWEELLGDYLPFTEVVDATSNLRLPRCSDERDQMFIDLAAATEADALVTGDPHLLDMADELPFEVLTPAELGRRWGRT